MKHRKLKTRIMATSIYIGDQATALQYLSERLGCDPRDAQKYATIIAAKELAKQEGPIDPAPILDPNEGLATDSMPAETLPEAP